VIDEELHGWVNPRKLGWVLDSNGGTRYKDGDMRAADVDKGVAVGVYVDPKKHRVELHRRGTEPVTLGDDVFEVPDILPGFSFPVSELWPE